MSRTSSQPWPLDPLPCSTDGLSVEAIAAAKQSAVNYLWALTGRRVGSFTTVEDGYRPVCGDACGMPYKDSAGRWRNGGRGGHDCCRIELWNQPVAEVLAVAVHGELLDPAAYVVEGNTLLRLDACWPCCDDCEPACVVVDYRWGFAPSAFAVEAARELACEFLRAAAGEACRLPARASSITRQGVTIDMDSAEEFAQRGLTGIAVVDAFIRTVNPNGLVQRSRVLSPDRARRAG